MQQRLRSRGAAPGVGAGAFLGGEDEWAGQGVGRGLLAVKSHLLRP